MLLRIDLSPWDITLLQHCKTVFSCFAESNERCPRLFHHLRLPSSAPALDFPGEIQVSAIAKLIKNLHRGTPRSVHPSCPQCCETMYRGKHPWLIPREKTGKVGTCLLQPKPTPAKIQTGESSGLPWASPASWWPTSSTWVRFGFASGSLRHMVSVFKVPVRRGPARSRGAVSGRGALLQVGFGVQKSMFPCVWAEACFACGLEERR